LRKEQEACSDAVGRVRRSRENGRPRLRPGRGWLSSSRRYDVEHRQHDRLLWAFAATIGALSGCQIKDTDPFDVPSTSSASSRENGLEVNGISGNRLDVNALSLHSAEASGQAPDQRVIGGLAPALSAFDPGIPAGVDPGTPTYSASSTPIAREPVGFD